MRADDHGVVSSHGAVDEDVLHIIDDICWRGIGVTLSDDFVHVAALRDVVPDINFAADVIAHDQIKVVHQLEACSRIARRIGPGQGKAQRVGARERADRYRAGVALAGVEGVGVKQRERPGADAAQPAIHSCGQRIAQVHGAPPLKVDGGLHLPAV